MSHIKIIFCVAFVLGCLRVQAQNNPYFEVLSANNVLPQNDVLCHMQDYLGYIWLGTQNGLARYDGYGSKVYRISFPFLYTTHFRPEAAKNTLRPANIPRLSQQNHHPTN